MIPPSATTIICYPKRSFSLFTKIVHILRYIFSGGWEYQLIWQQLYGRKKLLSNWGVFVWKQIEQVKYIGGRGAEIEFEINWIERWKHTIRAVKVALRGIIPSPNTHHFRATLPIPQAQLPCKNNSAKKYQNCPLFRSLIHCKTRTSDETCELRGLRS